MDRKKLKIEMIRKEYLNKDLAKDLDITEATLYYKLSGRSEFLLSEIKQIVKSLNLTSEEMHDIFFN